MAVAMFTPASSAISERPSSLSLLRNTSIMSRALRIAFILLLTYYEIVFHFLLIIAGAMLSVNKDRGLVKEKKRGGGAALSFQALLLAAIQKAAMLCIALATPTGFEPVISTVTGWHVRPLHYGAAALTGSTVMPP